MRFTHCALALALALSLAACGGDDPETTESSTGDEATDAPVPPMATVDPPPEGDPRVNATAGGCRSSADCGRGEQCIGGEGCDQPWTCQPMRGCTRDLVTYCSCQGETVQGSGSCPPEPYAHRGPCE